MEFWNAVGDHPLAFHALLMALLSSVACGIVGTYVVTRRITYIAAGIAHCVLGGLGVAKYLQVVQGWAWLDPMHGAVASALLAALLIGWAARGGREREDTAISAVWAVGMAIGILFIYLTPGYNQDLMSYLFGNILLVSSSDLWLVLLLNVGILVTVIIAHERLQAVCFDEEFARLRGLKTGYLHSLLLLLTALTVVLLVSIVGIVLVIALLALPAAIAGKFARSMIQMMIVATLLCMGFSVLGLTLSYGPDLPAGPMIILVAGLAYLLVFLGFQLPRLRRRGG